MAAAEITVAVEGGTTVRSRLRVIAVESTTGVLAIGGLITVATAIVLAVIGSHPVPLLWPDRAMLAALACVFTAPMLAGVACVHVHRRVAGLSESAAAAIYGRRFVPRIGLISGLLWAVLVAAVQVVATTLAHPPFGAPFTPVMLLPWVMCPTLLGGAVSVGVLVGSCAAGHGWAPVLSLVVFGWLYGSTFLPGRWLALAPVDNSTYFTLYTEPTPALPLLHSGLGCAFVCSAIAVVGHRSRVRLIAGVLAVALATGCGVGIVTGSPDRDRPLHLSGPPACADRPVQSGRVALCVWPTMPADVLPTQLAALARAREIIGNQWPVPMTFAQSGLPASVDGRRIVLQSSITPSLAALVAATAMAPSCSADAAGNTAQTNLTAWLLNRMGVSQSAGTAPAAIARKSEQLQSQWVREQLRRGTCDG